MKMDKFRDSYKKFTEIIVETFSISLFTIVLLSQFYNIFSRYTKIGRPMMWVEELTRYSFIWITFLMWHLAQRKGTHFVVDIFQNKLSSKPKYFIEIFVSLSTIFFAFLVIYSSWLFIPTTMLYNAQSFRKIPMGIFYMVIPIGMVMILIEEILILIDKFTKYYKDKRWRYHQLT